MRNKKCKYNCVRGRYFDLTLKMWVDCPECRDITKVLEEPDENDGLSFFDVLEIPESYKNVGVSGEELFTTTPIPAYYTKESVASVINLIETINRNLYLGRVTNISFYLYVTNLVDIRQFVYGAQKLALEKGLGVTPYISLNTLYSILKATDYDFSDIDLEEVRPNLPPDMLTALDGWKYMRRTKLTYYDFKYADLCFLEATSSTMEKGWSALADLLAERARNNLPTYVIGYWAASVIAKNTGLKFLLANHGITRLDRLVPYEVVSKRGGNSGRTVGIQKAIPDDVTKSLELSGIRLEEFMENEE